MDRIKGCRTARKCLVACLFLEESQQPTWPQIKHKRRCTQRSPISTHSGQTCVPVVVIFTSSRCLHCLDIYPLSSDARSHFAKSAPAAYVLSRNSINIVFGDSARRISSYIRKNSDIPL